MFRLKIVWLYKFGFRQCSSLICSRLDSDRFRSVQFVSNDLILTDLKFKNKFEKKMIFFSDLVKIVKTSQIFPKIFSKWSRSFELNANLNFSERVNWSYLVQRNKIFEIAFRNETDLEFFVCSNFFLRYEWNGSVSLIFLKVTCHKFGGLI